MPVPGRALRSARRISSTVMLGSGSPSAAACTSAKAWMTSSSTMVVEAHSRCQRWALASMMSLGWSSTTPS
eukprot:3282624-Pyramimonas_sp.AAC.1